MERGRSTCGKNQLYESRSETHRCCASVFGGKRAGPAQGTRSQCKSTESVWRSDALGGERRVMPVIDHESARCYKHLLCVIAEQLSLSLRGGTKKYSDAAKSALLFVLALRWKRGRNSGGLVVPRNGGTARMLEQNTVVTPNERFRRRIMMRTLTAHVLSASRAIAKASAALATLTMLTSSCFAQPAEEAVAAAKPHLNCPICRRSAFLTTPLTGTSFC